MNLVFLSILLIQVATNALPAISLSISTRGDPESRKTVLNGKEYTATPLPKDFQGPGQTFKLEGGFQVGGKLVPAILKRVLEKEGGDDENSRTVQEIKFLKKPSVGLHLFSQWSETGTDELPYQADIVIKDLREQDPPLKPFHEWYQEDKRIHGPVGLRILYQNLEERLIWYAEHKNLFVGDVNMKNVFVERKYVTDNITELDPEAKGFPIMPTFWEPADADVYGIDDISYENDQAGLMKAYKDFLSSVLEQRFSVEVLAENLKPDGELRSVDIRRERFRGKTYDLLQIKIESPSTTLYKIVGGFEFENRNGEMTNVPALMTIRTPERGEDEDRGRPTQGGRHLGAEERKGLFLNVYTDGRSRQ